MKSGHAPASGIRKRFLRTQRRSKVPAIPETLRRELARTQGGNLSGKSQLRIYFY